MPGDRVEFVFVVKPEGGAGAIGTASSGRPSSGGSTPPSSGGRSTLGSMIRSADRADTIEREWNLAESRKIRAESDREIRIEREANLRQRTAEYNAAQRRAQSRMTAPERRAFQQQQMGDDLAAGSITQQQYNAGQAYFQGRDTADREQLIDRYRRATMGMEVEQAQIARSLSYVGMAAIQAARGFAFLGASGEESATKILQALAKVEGVFYMMRAIPLAISSIQRASISVRRESFQRGLAEKYAAQLSGHPDAARIASERASAEALTAFPMPAMSMSTRMMAMAGNPATAGPLLAAAAAGTLLYAGGSAFQHYGDESRPIGTGGWTPEEMRGTRLGAALGRGVAGAQTLAFNTTTSGGLVASSLGVESGLGRLSRQQRWLQRAGVYGQYTERTVPVETQQVTTRLGMRYRQITADEISAGYVPDREDTGSLNRADIAAQESRMRMARIHAMSPWGWERSAAARTFQTAGEQRGVAWAQWGRSREMLQHELNIANRQYQAASGEAQLAGRRLAGERAAYAYVQSNQFASQEEIDAVRRGDVLEARRLQHERINFGDINVPWKQAARSWSSSRSAFNITGKFGQFWYRESMAYRFARAAATERRGEALMARSEGRSYDMRDLEDFPLLKNLPQRDTKEYNRLMGPGWRTAYPGIYEEHERMRRGEHEQSSQMVEGIRKNVDAYTQQYATLQDEANRRAKESAEIQLKLRKEALDIAEKGLKYAQQELETYQKATAEGERQQTGARVQWGMMNIGERAMATMYMGMIDKGQLPAMGMRQHAMGLLGASPKYRERMELLLESETMGGAAGMRYADKSQAMLMAGAGMTEAQKAVTKMQAEVQAGRGVVDEETMRRAMKAGVQTPAGLNILFDISPDKLAQQIFMNMKPELEKYEKTLVTELSQQLIELQRTSSLLLKNIDRAKTQGVANQAQQNQAGF